MSFRIDKEFYAKLVAEVLLQAEYVNANFERMTKRKQDEADYEYRKTYEEKTSEKWLKTHRGEFGYYPNVKVDDLDAKKIAEAIGIRSLYYCPIDTGKLKSSFSMKAGNEETDAGGVRKVYIIKYDGKIAPYAIYVHALVDKWHQPPTRAKFLEDAAMDIINANKAKWLRKNFPISIYMVYKYDGSIGCLVYDNLYWDQEYVANDNTIYLLYSNVAIIENRMEEKERRREERKQEAKRLREERKYLSTLDDEAAKLRELMESGRV